MTSSEQRRALKDVSGLDAAGVARACARVLRAAGFPLYKQINKWECSPGIHCHRVGYSADVAIGWLGDRGYSSDSRDFERRERERWAWETLRHAGYPVDDIGYIRGCRDRRY